MPEGSDSWLERLQGLPRPVRAACTLSLPILVLVLAEAYPGALSPGHLQLLLLTGTVLAALLLGLAAGLAGAALGFGIMLWAAFQMDAGGTPSLSLVSVLDAFLWFALAKVIVVLVAAPQGTIARLLAAGRRSDLDSTRRELLFNEMSHRFRNDLGSLVSMLHIQASTDPGAADALNAAADRVLMLGRVHGRLSRSGVPEAIVDSRLFLEGLLTDLRAGLDGLRPVTLVVDAEAHPLPLARAGDIGLVVNELVTNALKHAFPSGREGIVRVTFRRMDALFELSVADNGVGFPPGQRPQQIHGAGLGSRILRALAAQLGGRLDVVSGQVGGTVCLLQFPVPPSVPKDTAASALAPEPGVIRTMFGKPIARLRRGRR